MTAAAKTALRRQYAAARRSVPEKAALDAEIRRLVAGLPEFAAAAYVSIYAADAEEPDLLPLLSAFAGKRFMAPRYVAAEQRYEFALLNGMASLTVGRYGLGEADATCPKAPEEAVRHDTLHLIPGVAFDGAGVRLGRGGGFYDRLLAGVRSPVCGVFYAVQQCEALPAEPHDRRVDLAVTERGVFYCNRQTGSLKG